MADRPQILDDIDLPNREGATAPSPLELIVTIPCLNEEETIADVVCRVPQDLPGISTEVVVIDDGSTDATAERARQAGALVIQHPKNLGLGVSFRDGIQKGLELGADIIVNIDGDGQFDPTDIPKLLDPIVSGEAEMVTASRFADPKLVPEMPRIKRWGNRIVALIVWIITGQSFKDVSCGFRAFSQDALLKMNLFGGFTYTQESFIDLAFKEVQIAEIPIRVRGTRQFGQSRMASNIPRYGYRALKIMLRAAIGYRPFRFFMTIAAVFFAVGLGLLGFLTWHFLQTGAFSPHIWAGFVGGSFTFLGIMTTVIGLMADMLVRMRLNQEYVLYLLKRSSLQRVHEARHSGAA